MSFSGDSSCSGMAGNLGGLLVLAGSVGEASEHCLVLGSVDLSLSTPFGDSIPAALGGPWLVGPFGAGDASSSKLFGGTERADRKSVKECERGREMKGGLEEKT